MDYIVAEINGETFGHVFKNIYGNSVNKGKRNN
jgi:hypothetical protein